MRQVFIQVTGEHGDIAKTVIQAYSPINLTQLQAEDDAGPTWLFIANVSNRKIEALFDELQSIPRVRITLVPQGIFAFRLATPHIPDQVTDIELLSPVEVFLSGLQSIGSWKGFLGYAVAASVLVWIGLLMNSVVLLIAGMLVSPFASPAMNLAIATARSDITLLRHSLLRYGAAIATAIIVSAGLTVLLDINLITRQMDIMGQVSEWAVLIPLVVGVGGALSMMQSNSSSLVSGTVSGLLVAASLAPPVVLIGVGTGMGEWDMVRTAVFVVLLQLVGINLAGALVLRLNNVKSENSPYERGQRWLFPIGISVTLLALVGLLIWQRADAVELERASLAQKAAMHIRTVVDQEPSVDLIELQTRFTRTDIAGQNSLLVLLYVQPRTGTAISVEEIRSRLRGAIQAKLRDGGYDLTPLIDISVLDPP